MKKVLCFLALVGLSASGCSQSTNTTAQLDNATSTAMAVSSESATDSVPAATQTANDARPDPGRFVQADSKTATLKAKFVYDGPAPDPAKIDGSKDPFCGDLDIVSEAMVVGDDGGLQNLALYIDTRKTKVDLPEVAVDEKAEIVLDNKGCIFVPHVLTARPGQKVVVTNSDPNGHNANFNFFNNTAVNFLVPGGGKKDLVLQADEPAPIPVECNVHPWMKSYLIVTEHPFVGVTNEKGELTIEGLPVGEVTFKVWHENAEKSIDEAMVGGEKQKWSRGRMEIELKPGVNDLGTIKLSPDLFKK